MNRIRENGSCAAGIGLVSFTMWILVFVILQSPQDSLAQEATVCSDETITGGVLSSVTVEEGTSCTLETLTVIGNMKAMGAADIMVIDVDISGNVTVKNSMGIVDISGAIIGGNVSIKKSTSTLIQIANSQVEGNVTVKGNNVEGSLFDNEGIIFIRPNDIGGNLTVVRNTAGAGLLIGSCVSGGNNVGGNLTMSRNTAEFAASVNCSDVGGNLSVEGNRVNGGVLDSDEDVQITGNTVGGNLSVRNNTAADQVAVGDNLAEEGQPELFMNVVSGNLLCSRNDPDPRTEATDPADSDPVEEGNIVNGRLDCSD